jgi:hypothetical protein
VGAFGNADATGLTAVFMAGAMVVAIFIAAVENITNMEFQLARNTHTNPDLWNTTVGYGLHFKHRNTRTLPIYSFAHDCGRALVRAEYGYLKGSPNTNS